MHLELLLPLFGWVGLWWLAVRVVFGRSLGAMEWLPVAIAAFAVPILMADMSAAHGREKEDSWMLLAWGGVAVVIDAWWLVLRARRLWKR